MNIIKLNAIPSTNEYLKEMAVSSHLNDFTIVVADNQTKGKGQMGAVWEVESCMNLTFSVLLNSGAFFLSDIFTVNIAMANSIHKTLLGYGVLNVSVKWPNDIMSYNKKLGGILIENNIRANGDVQSVIGVGLNVNQMNFDGLPQATSILKATGFFLDKDKLMVDIVDAFRDVILNLEMKKTEEWKYYHQNLFKKNIPVTFERYTGVRFTGMIVDVNQLGQLGVLDETNKLTYFNLKEIKMLY